MTPVINTTPIYTPPPTLVAAVAPGNQTLRAHADNVAETLSNVQINNENKNNNSVVAQTARQLSAPAGANSGFSLSPFIYTTPTSLSASAQTTFFAQLMSQDGSAQTQGVLAGYEKLVAYGNVKYLPSNAALPEPEPANVFARALQQERQISNVQQATQQQQTAATTTVASNANIANVSVPKETGTPQRNENNNRTTATAKSTATASAPRSAAINAYLAVVARNEATFKKKSDQPIEAA